MNMSNLSNPLGITESPHTKRMDWTLLEILPLLTLAASLAITYLLWTGARHDAEHTLQTQFEYRVRDTINDVSKRMSTYEQVMRGVDGFFSHDRIIERSEFHDYVTSLLLRESYPGIQGIRFVPIVRNAEKNRHIAAIRATGLSTYTIWPEAQRDIYAPVTYIEPFDVRNQQVFGYDMLSDSDYPHPGDYQPGMRRNAIEQARDSGNITISGKIRPLYEPENGRQNGFVMFLPFYRHDAPHETIAERRTNIAGWISSVFLADDLMDGILGERGSEIDIEIYDGVGVTAETVMYDSHPNILHQNPRFRTTRQLKIADHTWTIAVHSLPGFEAQMDVEKPRIIGYSGIFTSTCLALFIWSLVISRKRALQASKALKQEMTERQQAAQALHEVEERFRYIFEYSKVGINLIGPDYNYLRINRAFCEMSGYSEAELLAHDFQGITHPDDIELNKALSKKLLEGEIDYFNIQKKYIRKNGDTWHGDLTVSAMRDENRNLLYGIAIIQDISERMHIEQQLRNLTGYLQSVREEEKASIAREIHDNLGGILTSMKIESYWLRTELSENNQEEMSFLEHIGEMSKLIDHATGVMRDVITGLRPTILDDLGLLAALEWQAMHFQNRTGIKCRVNCIGDKGGLDKARSIELFRISQEALSNVARHSGASSVEFEYLHDDNEVVLSIIDNGSGMVEAYIDTSKHFGLLGMRERVDQLNGEISFDTPPGGGFSVTIILPLSADNKENI